jgi:hypothetical protein
MSVADIIAAAKANKSGAAPAATAPAAKASPAAAPVQEPEPAAEEPEVASPAATDEPAADEPVADAGGKKSKRDAFKSIDEIIAYCRQVDAK